MDGYILPLMQVLSREFIEANEIIYMSEGLTFKGKRVLRRILTSV